jgi:hypothetical protein
MFFAQWWVLDLISESLTTAATDVGRLTILIEMPRAGVD